MFAKTILALAKLVISKLEKLCCSKRYLLSRFRSYSKKVKPIYLPTLSQTALGVALKPI
jgi:hypothetical protein